MSRIGLQAEEELVRFPRVSGDEPVLLAVVAVVVSFSPRERG